MISSFMGTFGERVIDLLNAGITGKITLDSTDGIILEPDNHFAPLTDITDGEPDGYDLSLSISEPIGRIVNISPEGVPRKNLMGRVNTTLIPMDQDSYVQEVEIPQGFKAAPTSDREADPILVTTIPATDKAFRPATYLMWYGYSQRIKLLKSAKKRKRPRGLGPVGSGVHGIARPDGLAGPNPAPDRGNDERKKKKGAKRTPTSSWTSITLGAGEIPRFFTPDAHPPQATHLDIYMSKPNGSVGFLQMSVPITSIIGGNGYVDVHGPLKTAIKAPIRNTTGIESPKKREVKRDFRIAGSPGGRLKEAYYTPAAVFQFKGGVTEASKLGKGIEVVGDKEWKQTGTEQIEVPPDDPRAQQQGEARTGSFSSVTSSGGISDRRVRLELGDAVYEAMARRAPSLRAGESVSSKDAEILAEAQAAPSASAVSRPFHEAEGKRTSEESPYVRAGGQYMGEEIDFEESRFVSLINAEREEHDLPPLILNRDLNRMAYREVGGEAPEPEYPFEVVEAEDVETLENSADEAFTVVANPDFPVSFLEGVSCVGIAREPSTDGFKWCLVYGDRVVTWDDVEEEEGPPYCEIVDPEGNTHRYGAPDSELDGQYLGSVAPDGTEFAEGLSANSPQGWSCVGGSSSSPRLGWSYSGSYSASHSNGAGNWVGKCKVRVSQGGSDVRASDASLSGPYGKTYSDGRMYGDSYLMSVKSGQTNEAMWTHEYGHALGSPHSSSSSDIMYYSVVDGRDPDPTSADVSRVRGYWGEATSGGGGGTGGGTGGGDDDDDGGETGGNEEPDTVTIDVPVFELVNIGYKKNACLEIDIPDLMRANLNPALRWIPYVYVEPLTPGTDETGTGGRTCYRLFPAYGSATTAFNNVGQFKARVRWSGYPPESQDRKEAVRSVQEEPPTENTTRVVPPDPTQAPDLPIVSPESSARPDPGPYWVNAQDVYADGTISKPSATRRINLAPSGDQMIKVEFAQSVNMIANANFSQTDRYGYPTSWARTNIDNVQTNVVNTTTPGVCKLDAQSSVSTPPVLVSLMQPIGGEAPVTVGGRVALERQTDGRAVVHLRQYRDDGTLISDLSVISVDGLFDVPFSKTFTASERDPECAYVALRIGLATGTSAVNARAAFSFLRGFPFATDIRQFGPGEGDELDSFEPEKAGPEAAYPLYSYLGVGNPPVPEGGTTEEAAPPELVMGFATGTLPSGVTESNFNSAAGGLTTTSPIDGTRSHRSQDASADLRKHRTLTCDLTTPSGKTTRARVASRALYRWDRLPSTGPQNQQAYFHDIWDNAGNTLCRLKQHQSGKLEIEVNEGGNTRTSVLSYGITQGQVFDVETIWVGGEDGFVSVGLSLGSAPRQIVHTRNYNFGARKARYLKYNVTTATDPRVQYDLYVDQCVVTDGGDVPKRERPVTTPSGFVSPPPDRPVLSGAGTTQNPYIYRTEGPPDREGNNALSPQVYIFLRPRDATLERPEIVSFFDVPEFVWPGETYTVAPFRRWVAFSQGAPGFRVRLSGDGLKDLVLEGSALTGPLKGVMGSSRGWHRTGVEDDYFTFTVPAPVTDDDGNTLAYTEAQVEAVLTAGEYVFQDLLFTRGAITSFAAREAKRTLKYATSASLTAVLDARPPRWEHGVPQAGLYVTEFGVNHELAVPLDDGTQTTSLDVLYSTSKQGFGWSVPTYDKDDIAILEAGGPVAPRTPERFMRFEISPKGDGWDTPRINAGGILVRTTTDIGQILRSDGTPFPGCAFVGNDIVYTDNPQVTFNMIAGHVQRTRESEDVKYVYDIEVATFTEEAYQDLAYLAATDDLMMTIPTLGNRVAGQTLYIRPATEMSWEKRAVPPGILQAYGDLPARELLMVGTLESAEIVEVLDSPEKISGNMRVEQEWANA